MLLLEKKFKNDQLHIKLHTHNAHPHKHMCAHIVKSPKIIITTMFVELTIMTHFSLLAFYYLVYHVVT
jgi:hypothetical protein